MSEAEEGSAQEERMSTKERFEHFLNAYPSAENAIYIDIIRDRDFGENINFLNIDFSHIIQFDEVLAENILELPKKVIKKCESVIDEVYEKVKSKKPSLKLHLRLKNLPDIHRIPIRNIRASNVSKLVSLDGVVTRITEVKPEIKEAVFECQRCGNVIIMPQIDTIFKTPSICDNPACRKQGPFELIKEESLFEDWQMIRLQERPEQLRGGKMPRHIEVILRDDLVDKVQPGNRILLTGIIESSQDKSRGKKRTFSLFSEANNIDSQQVESEEINISSEDEKKIFEMSQDPLITEKISKSIAPSIYGYDALKKAIALLLFGGSTRTLSDGTRLRGDCNILFVGDPGLGKSQLLRFTTMLAPRGMYTSGKGSTAAGLTAAAIRDEVSGGWALEAGALVLADGGVAAVDEFEKMNTEDRSSIHEIMEQGTVSIAKAGIVATLNARTSVLAAANPKYGRFDKSLPISEQINLPPALISRFDLIFSIMDEPDVKKDSDLARHVINIRNDDKQRVSMMIEKNLLRKYIAYSKNLKPPKISPSAAKRLQEFYVEMRRRKPGEEEDTPISITVRQLESLTRISEAHAKMRLSQEVLVDDVEEAIKIMKLCLKSVGVDPETHKIDIDIIMTGTSKSQRNRFETILDIIKQLESESPNGQAEVDMIYDLAQKKDIKKSFVKKTLDNLKRNGEIFEPTPGQVRRVIDR